MLKGALLELLNAEATALGRGAITERMLEDWISEGLIERPKAKGRRRGANPEWRYSPGAAERGLQLVRLRARGTKRFAAQRLQLYLAEFDLPASQIKIDLHAEFQRLLKRRFFRRPLEYDARTQKRLAKDEIEIFGRKLGPVDPRLVAAGLKPSVESLLEAGSELSWGPSAAKKLLRLIVQEISNLARWMPAEIAQNIFADIEPYFEVAGLFGSPEEIEKSGLEELAKFEEIDLENGRIFYRLIVGLFEIGATILPLSTWGDWREGNDAMKAILVSLKESDEWSVMCFAMGALGAALARCVHAVRGMFALSRASKTRTRLIAWRSD